MKGVVFEVFRQIVEDEHGHSGWDQLLQDAGLEGGYTALGNYDDEELIALVEAASQRHDMPSDEVVRWLGRDGFEHLADRYPQFVEEHDDLFAFLLTLNDVIHPEVRKLYPGAYAPQFEFARPSQDVLELGYDSKRGLCAFAEGLVLGAGDHFDTDVSVDQPRCVHEDDGECVIRCSREATA